MASTFASFLFFNQSYLMNNIIEHWEEIREKIKWLKEDWKKNKEIADILGIWERQVYNHLAKMKDHIADVGKKVEKEEVVQQTKQELELLKIVNGFTPEQLKEILYHSQLALKKDIEIWKQESWHALFGAIWDSHFGSKACNYEWINRYYDELEKRWVKTVLHAWDIVDWYWVYKWHTFELAKLSMDDQINDVIENYPKRDWIDTYYILWNHDEARLKLVWYDISKQIDLLRKDMHCLGWYNARIKIDWVDVELHHWGGSNSYSLSYKPQKYLENVNPKDQPNVYLLWHFHSALYMFYRKIHAFMVGSFQNETLLSKRFKLGNTQWWWIIDVSLDDKWGTIINMEFISVK